MVDSGHTFIGPVGRLARISCPSVLQTGVSRSVNVFETLGGRDVVQWQHVRARAWDLKFGATSRPADVSILIDLLTGSRPPWEFINDHMAVTNLVTPDGTAFQDGTFSNFAVRAGGVTCNDGVALASTIVPHPPTPNRFTYVGMYRSDGVFWRGPTVIPGQPITFSVYMNSLAPSSLMRLGFFDAAQNLIENQDKTVFAPSEGFDRVSFSTVVPENAAWVNPMVSQATRVGGVSLALTSAPPPYSAGQGVRGVYLNQIDTDVTHIRGVDVYQSASFVVREVRDK